MSDDRAYDPMGDVFFAAASRQAARQDDQNERMERILDRITALERLVAELRGLNGGGR